VFVESDAARQHGDIERGSVRVVAVEELAAAEATHRPDDVTDLHPDSGGAVTAVLSHQNQVRVTSFAEDLGRLRSVAITADKSE